MEADRASILEAAAASAAEGEAVAAGSHALQEEEEDEEMYLDAEQPHLEVVIKEEAAEECSEEGEGE